MKKLILIIAWTIILRCLGIGCFAQEFKAQEGKTIYVDMKGSVTLILPFQINLVEVGSDDFIAEPNGKLVLLKAVKPSTGVTNLLIRFGIDQYFQGFVGYKKEVEQRYYDFRHQLNPQQRDSVRVLRADQNLNISEEKVANLLEGFHPGLDVLPKMTVCQDLIGLSLLSIRNGPELTYIWLRIDNRTSLPYHIRQVNVQFRSKSRSRKLGDQIIQRPLIAPQIPSTVAAKGRAYLSFAIPHFASGKRSQLEILIGENTGNRVIALKVKNIHIMNAEMLNPLNFDQNGNKKE